MPAADVLCGDLGLLALALQDVAGKAEVEGLDRLARDVGHQRGDEARIDAAADERTEGHVGHQHRLDRPPQLPLDERDRLGFAERELVRIVRDPVAPVRELAAGEDERMPGLELLHVPVDAPRRRNVLALEVERDRREIELAAHRGVLEQRLQLRAEREHAAVPVVVERLHAEMVAREEERLLALVPEREREHARDPVEHALAPLLPGVDEHLGVAVGVERVPGRRELAAQALEVVDLAVEHHHHGAVLVEERLRAAGEVDDAQAAVAETDAPGDVEALGVGAAVGDDPRHPLQHVGRVLALAPVAGDAAHAGAGRPAQAAAISSREYWIRCSRA